MIRAGIGKLGLVLPGLSGYENIGLIDRLV